MSNLILKGQLQARTAVHIGSGATNDLTDALLRRDAQGKLILPGSAIAGALRTLLTRLAPSLGYTPCQALQKPQKRTTQGAGCTCPVCQLFGDVNPSDAPNSKSSASRLIVRHAPLATNTHPAANPASRIRDGVGIDRVSGVAARNAGAKFDLEVLPPGTTFDLRLELDGADAADVALLAAALAEWRAGRAALGGRVARGLGAFTLVKLEVRELALDDADSLIAYLQSDDPWDAAMPVMVAPEDSEPINAAPGNTPGHPPTTGDRWLVAQLRAARNAVAAPNSSTELPALCNWVEIQGALLGQGALLTNDSAEAAGYSFDHAPLLVQMGDLNHPVLTGAGLRGVLRSHAERIARTLATHAVADGGAFLAACPACDPLVNDPAAPLASCDSLLRSAPRKKSAMEQEEEEEEIGPDDLCLACQLFGSTQRGSRLLVEDAPYNEKAAGRAPAYKMLDFLAIDRFTGGGAEHLKFDALTLWKPAFTLRMRLENPQPWELGWLLLMLRDLAEGRLHVGYGAAKGFGRVTLGDWTLRIGYLDAANALGLPVAPWQAGQSIFAEQAWTFPAGQWPATNEWQAGVSQWVTSFITQATTFRRSGKLPVLKTDSYFNDKIDKLYERQVKEVTP